MVTQAVGGGNTSHLPVREPTLLAPEQLRAVYAPAGIVAESAGPLRPKPDVIGQPRATAALEFGLGMAEAQYNIVVTGPPGTGKMTTLKTYLTEVARNRPAGQDLCYVENFDDPEHPRALTLPAGCGRRFANDLARVVRAAQQQLPRVRERRIYPAGGGGTEGVRDGARGAPHRAQSRCVRCRVCPASRADGHQSPSAGR